MLHMRRILVPRTRAVRPRLSRLRRGALQQGQRGFNSDAPIANGQLSGCIGLEEIANTIDAMLAQFSQYFAIGTRAARAIFLDRV